jgi:hypothetical protein
VGCIGTGMCTDVNAGDLGTGPGPCPNIGLGLGFDIFIGDGAPLLPAALTVFAA